MCFPLLLRYLAPAALLRRENWKFHARQRTQLFVFDTWRKAENQNNYMETFYTRGSAQKKLEISRACASADNSLSLNAWFKKKIEMMIWRTLTLLHTYGIARKGKQVISREWANAPSRCTSIHERKIIAKWTKLWKMLTLLWVCGRCCEEESGNSTRVPQCRHLFALEADIG